MLESTASTIKNAHGEVEKLVIVNRDITERKRLEEQLEHDSFHDPLTNLPNRRLFLNRLQHCFVRSQRDPAYRYAVLLVDLDGFRALADSISPTAGDVLIIEAGRRVQACLRERDTVARPTTNLPSDDVLLPRSGGDEFAVLLEEIGDPIQAMRTATRIQEALSRPFVGEGGPVEMSASIGIAISTADQHAAEDLLVDADNALQRAQVLGGSRCEVHDEGMHVRVIRRLKLEGELKTAIDRGQFPLCFQPIVNLETRQIVGLEALLRWQHPQHGTVLPSKFIEVAEDIGLTISLGKVVIRQACDEMRTWQSRHLTPLPLVMTVNISAKQFVSADLVKDVRAALRETQVDPCRLQLEVAEHTVMADPALSLEVLNRLKHLGIRISIGDFGSGQSSLSLLRRLSIDELKIDRALVNNMLADRISCDIAGLIVTVARSLKVQVVAEGIETAVQLDRLRKLGCEFGQGYFFSAPVGSQVAEQLLQESLEKSAK
jgi:diguanylate cyclase (GGDEF)-like protein